MQPIEVQILALRYDKILSMTSQNVFTVHRLWPEEGAALDYNPKLAIIFFHGLQIRDGHKAWEATWTQRQGGDGESTPVCWPKAWLPRDLGEKKVVVYSLSYDADATQWYGRGNTDDVEEIGKDLISKLVASPKWRLDQTQIIALVGHSFGGLVIKSLIVEAKKLATLPEQARRNDVTRATSDACAAFLAKVKCAVFYGTPHSGSDAVNLVQNLQKLAKLTRVPLTLAGILKNLQPFQRDMEVLSVKFQDAAPQDINIFAFGEGRPISLWGGLSLVLVVPYASAMRLSSNNNMKIEDANHYEVCKPPYREHVSYTKLLEVLQLVMQKADDDDLT